MNFAEIKCVRNREACIANTINLRCSSTFTFIFLFEFRKTRLEISSDELQHNHKSLLKILRYNHKGIEYQTWRWNSFTKSPEIEGENISNYEGQDEIAFE